MSTITRRAALFGVATSTAALAVPSVTANRGELLDPETRISKAIEEIRLALAEAHPDWKFQVEDRSVGVIAGASTVQSAPRRRGIVLYASDERFGPETARLYVDYPSVMAR